MMNKYLTLKERSEFLAPIIPHFKELCVHFKLKYKHFVILENCVDLARIPKHPVANNI